MRIGCTYCGERGHEEFVYLGDATLERPDADPMLPVDDATWHAYVYQRENPSGPHRELWQHAGGCRAWLVITRDTRTHAIQAVEPARAAAIARSSGTP